MDLVLVSVNTRKVSKENTRKHCFVAVVNVIFL